MADSFNLRILTPAGTQYQGAVSSVKLVTADGEIGILPGHVKYVGLLGTGVMEFTPVTGTAALKAVVSGGFCRYAGETLEVLADTVDLPETIDRANYAKRRAEFEKIVNSESLDSPDWIAAKEQLSRIEAIEGLVH